MRPVRPVPEFVVSPSKRTAPEEHARRPTTAQALALRARIILRCATGATHTAIAAKLDVTFRTVGKWRQRFVATRVAGLLDESPGARRNMTDAQTKHAIATTLELQARSSVGNGECAGRRLRIVVTPPVKAERSSSPGIAAATSCGSRGPRAAAPLSESGR